MTMTSNWTSKIIMQQTSSGTSLLSAFIPLCDKGQPPQMVFLPTFRNGH